MITLRTKPFVRRFYSDLEKAKTGAKLLLLTLEKSENVLIFKNSYGFYGAKKAEYSLRLVSEGARKDSNAIVCILKETAFDFS